MEHLTNPTAADRKELATQKKVIVKNYYFKQGDGLMSGRPLPEANELGYIVDIHFIDCDFHPNCDTAMFKDCEFTGCNGLHYLEHRHDCVTHLPSTFCG